VVATVSPDGAVRRSDEGRPVQRRRPGVVAIVLLFTSCRIGSHRPRRQPERIILRGDPPSPAAPPPAGRFHTRCRYATEIFRAVEPPLVDYGNGHLAACHHPLNVGVRS
jgi:oligopeptide/dipeptide ABC transporter ATP-binding protein